MNITHKSKSSLKQQIYSEVMGRIVKGVYPPESLLTEKSLLEEFGVSKSPVREALIELCNEKILRSIPRCGYEVVKITEQEVKNIQEYRIILECNCLDYFWNILTPAHGEKLKAELYEHYSGTAEYDILEHWRLNSKFHTTLISFYQNKYLYDNLNSAVKFLTRAYAQFYWDKWQQPKLLGSAGSHKKVVEHIINNNKEEAISCLRQDISEFDGVDSGLKQL